MASQIRRFDVLLATDFRLPGGTVASIVEEARALHGAGYTVGLAQVFSPLVAKARPLNDLVRQLLDAGLATLVIPQQQVDAKLVVLRHPSVFATAPSPAPTVRAPRVVLVANQAAADRDGVGHYDPLAVDRSVADWVGTKPLWAPIGPLVRESLRNLSVQMLPGDWVNVIDVDEWAADRTHFRDEGRPVVGRHSRPQPSKWPDRREDLLAAYPTDGTVRVRILGGAESPGQVLGGIPDAWEVEEFGARSAKSFLADIDFFVYYHRPGTVEAFGRTVMEAMASGAVAILDPALRPSFGDAAIYAEPQRAMELVHEFRNDPAAFGRQQKLAQRWVRANYGHEKAVSRVQGIIGDTEPSAITKPKELPVVLFVSSNGAGMGHLTRLLAIAKRSMAWCRPVFLSLSQAVPVVGEEGFPFEYFPSRAALDIGTSTWNPMFEERFRQAMNDHGPAAVVFDGTWPYLGIVRSRADYPEARFVWCRRAMWRPETPPDQLAKSQHFELVIEPGELAKEYDAGPTVHASDAVTVGPITYLRRDDLLPRDEARAELGLRADSTAMLVSLGAGNINDISSTLGAVTDALAQREDVQIVVTRSPISHGNSPLERRVKTVSVYPLSRYFEAFDGAVAAAGYNSFHESLMFGMPTAFVPNKETRTDDQVARARWAEDRQMGWFLDENVAGDVERVVQALLSKARREEVRHRLLDLYVPDGADQAATRLRDTLR